MRISKRLRGLSCGIALALALTALPAISSAGVLAGVSVRIAPPPIPVYEQPPCPASGYLWVPGYWAWGDDGYYWVPGTWVLPPAVGLLWTPGYWGWADGAYVWHAGYWGPHVGFYGGINYGFGYTGVGFAGGYWSGGVFFYNRAVANVASIHVRNVYSRAVTRNVSVTRVSFNGGPGGLIARPTRGELAAEHERHVAFTPTHLDRPQAHPVNRPEAQRFDRPQARPPERPQAQLARPQAQRNARPAPSHAEGRNSRGGERERR